MKKVLSMILAVLAVSAMTVPAFAQNTQTINQTSIEAKTISEGISFGDDEKTDTKLGSLLTPGKTYKFKLAITDKNGNTKDFSSSDMDNHRFSVQDDKDSSAVTSIGVVEAEGDYYLQIVTASGWTTKQSEVAYTLKYSGKSNGKSVYTNKITFKVGYNVMPDTALDSVAKDGELQVNPSTPVITTKQFAKIDKLVDGDKVVLTNGDWAFDVRVSAQEALNLVNNELQIKDIVEQYQNSKFKFVSFPAGPQFDYTGTLSINVYEEQDDWKDKFFVYKYYQGALTKIDATYDKEDGVVKFNTKSLGRFVVSDTEFKDGTVIESGFGGSDNPANKPSSDNNNSGNTKPNPETGSSDFAGIAVALATVSLVAGAVVLKRKEK